MFTAVKMLLVFGLLGGTLWFLRRHDRSSLVTARRAERPVAVLAQAKVGKTASVALVRIGGDAYAVGVTEQNVTLLVPEPVVLPDPDAEDETAAPTGRPAPPTVTDALRAALGRRPRVQYLDVVLPQQGESHQNSSASGTEGSGSSPTARMPEPARRR